MQLNIPNSLTLLRLFLIPIFVLFFYLPLTWGHIAAAVIFAVAAATDWLDGYLARKLGETTAFGAFLDPVADKVMVTTALILLVEGNPTAFSGMWLALPAAVIVAREITISALREWMAEVGERTAVAVKFIGKVKTSAQMLAIVLLLYREPIAGLDTAWYGFILFYVAAILTFWSMTVYLLAAWPVLVAQRDNP